MKKLILIALATSSVMALTTKDKAATAPSTSQNITAAPVSSSSTAQASKNDKKICKLKISIPVSKGMTIEDMGDMGCTVATPNYTFVVNYAGEYNPKTLEEANKNAVETYSGDQLTPTTLANGFILAYHNKNEYGDHNWFVDACLTINGKQYSISTLQPSQGHQAAAIAAIKTIH